MCNVNGFLSFHYAVITLYGNSPAAPPVLVSRNSSRLKCNIHGATAECFAVTFKREIWVLITRPFIEEEHDPTQWIEREEELMRQAQVIFHGFRG